jgi:hypothetical protein
MQRRISWGVGKDQLGMQRRIICGAGKYQMCCSERSVGVVGKDHLGMQRRIIWRSREVPVGGAGKDQLG